MQLELPDFESVCVQFKAKNIAPMMACSQANGFLSLAASDQQEGPLGASGRLEAEAEAVVVGSQEKCIDVDVEVAVVVGS